MADCNRYDRCFSREVLMVLREKLLEAMDTLGLYGMKATFDELIATGIKQRATPEKISADLLEAELAERQSEASVTAWAWPSSRWTRTWTTSTSANPPVNETAGQTPL